MTPVLDIYVATHCFGTAEALRIAGLVRQQLPNVKVKVTMLDEIPGVNMPQVPATPSYVLDGKLLFLGNPHLDELVARIVSHPVNRRENNGSA
ncbi:MAG: hypothetical protein HY670_02960 [Chloroflexi bacterium]|nr:hypothetical protein [Chloroflexota bacterium]